MLDKIFFYYSFALDTHILFLTIFGYNSFMKTIATTNKYFSSISKKRKIIVDAVHSSAKVEGSKITKKELSEHYNKIHL